MKSFLNRTFFLIATTLMIIVLAVSCSVEPTQGQTTTIPVIPGVNLTPTVQEETLTPTGLAETPTPTLEAEQAAGSSVLEPAASLTLYPEGPWALAGGIGGLWAVNPDGSGVTQISAQTLYKPADDHLQNAISPAGSTAAYVTISDPYMHNLTLHVVRLPGIEEILTLPLTSQSTEPPADMEGGDNFDPYIAAGDFAWAPDGQTLAFTALIEGETSDLYLYKLSDGSITRLTDGPSEAYQVSWSPDGRYILHFGAYGFGSGAGSPVDAAWLVDTQDESVHLLYTPQENGEYVDGWISPTEFLVHSWSAACGSFDYRLFDILTGTTSMQYEGSVRGSALDIQSGALLLLLEPTDICPVGYTDLSGIYIVWPDNPYLSELSTETAYFPYWLPQAQRFVIPGLGMTVTAEGRVDSFPEETRGYNAWSTSDGEWWAWTGDWYSTEPVGMWVGGSEQKPRLIYEAHVHAAQWSPDGDVVLFLNSQGLFAAYAPDFTPQKVTEMNAREFALVNP